MYNVYNFEARDVSKCLDCLIPSFKNYLYSERISSSSIRCYLSDLRHFFAWFTFFLKSNNIPLSPLSPSECSSCHNKINTKIYSSLLSKYINRKTLEAYTSYLENNKVPEKTINRRFSSLRKVGSFCKAQNWITMNSFDTLRNISLKDTFRENKFHLGEFQNNLKKEKASKSTVKNYLSDIKQFLAWNKKNSQFK